MEKHAHRYASTAATTLQTACVSMWREMEICKNNNNSYNSNSDCDGSNKSEAQISSSIGEKV